MRIIICSLLMLFLGYSGFAQQYSGILLSKKTGRPIPYANIGIAGKNIGTTSDDNGHFALPLDGMNDSWNNQLVRISMIGYEPISMHLADIKGHLSDNKLYLKEKENELAEVVIKSRELKHARLGNTADIKDRVIGFNKYSPGYEVGTYIKIKRKPTYIDSIRLNVASCQNDSIFLRVNIYEYVNDSFVNILQEPIYVYTSTAIALKDIVIDLTSKNIVVKHPFMISAELVKNLGDKELFFCAQMLGHPSYMRLTSQGEWKNMIIGAGFSAYVTY